jgi:peptidoglycan/LPS O-acetylase OafA/YrhL
VTRRARAASTTAWLVCVVATLLPAWLLIGLTGTRVGATSGVLLLLAAGPAVAGVVLSRSPSAARAERATAVVVAVLCVAAVALLAPDGDVTPVGLLLFGGAAALAAVVAALLVRTPSRSH